MFLIVMFMRLKYDKDHSGLGQVTIFLFQGTDLDSCHIVRLGYKTQGSQLASECTEPTPRHLQLQVVCVVYPLVSADAFHGEVTYDIDINRLGDAGLSWDFVHRKRSTGGENHQSALTG